MKADPIPLLVTFPQRLWDTKVSPARRHSIWAMMRADSLFRVVVSGPGWPNWCNDGSLASNIERVMPSAKAILCYKPLGTREAIRLNKIAECPVPRVLRFNEAWWPGSLAAKEAVQASASLVVCHHAVDVPMFHHAIDLLPDLRIACIPHCAEVTMFGHRPANSCRSIDALLAGNCGPSVYPLRGKWERVIAATCGQKATVQLKHPGYRKRSVQDCEKTVSRYAMFLGDAKIALVCSSKFKYPLAKYVEAAMSGCLVLGDMPDAAPDGYADMVATVPCNASPAELADTVNSWLSRPDDLIAKAELGQKVARGQFSQEDYARKFHAAVADMLGQ